MKGPHFSFQKRTGFIPTFVSQLPKVFLILFSVLLFFSCKNAEKELAGEELQKEKDSAMTLDSSYSFIIWDGRSNGSYNNILRAIEHQKKIKLYLNDENRYLESEKINAKEMALNI